MSEQCPNCLSIRIGKNNYGKKAAGVVGASIGAYSGFTAVTAGAQTGLAIGVRAGPVATACDGTMATTAQFTSIRVVCNNTLAVALKDATATAVKVKHNTAFDADLVKKQLGISVSAWDDFIYRLKTLSERKVKTTEARNYFLKVFTDDVKEGVGKTNERSMAKALGLYEGEGMGAALASPGGLCLVWNRRCR